MYSGMWNSWRAISNICKETQALVKGTESILRPFFLLEVNFQNKPRQESVVVDEVLVCRFG